MKKTISETKLGTFVTNIKIGPSFGNMKDFEI